MLCEYIETNANVLVKKNIFIILNFVIKVIHCSTL